jgi:hypothetical protein
MLFECGAESIEKFSEAGHPISNLPSAVSYRKDGMWLHTDAEPQQDSPSSQPQTPLQAPNALKRLVNVSCKGGTIFGDTVRPEDIQDGSEFQLLARVGVPVGLSQKTRVG